MKQIRANWDITLILIVFLLVGVGYSVINPLFEATDELRHYRFVRYIATERALPVQGEEPCRSQSHHPPLFYALGAVATAAIDTGRDICYTPPANPFWAYRYADVGIDNKNQYLHGPDEAFPWHGQALAVHIVRFINLLFGAATVWLTWAVGRAIWPRRRSLAAGATALVAFNPMFLYMAGAINNDVIAACSGVALLLASVRLIRDPQGLRPRWGLVLGALYGLALMSKFNMAAHVLLVAVAVTYVAWRERQWRAWLQVVLIAGGVTLVVAGWWFVRNQLLYGEPTGFRMVTELWGVRDPRESFPLAISELPHAWSTLWGRFGFGQIPMPEVTYRALAWFVLIGLAGVLPAVRRQQQESRLLVGLLLLNVLLSFAVLFNYMLVSPAGAMGRFFFPGLPPLALLTFFGWTQIGRGVLRLWARARRRAPDRLARELRAVPAILLHGAMLALALVALFGYLAPAYARPPAYAEDTQPPHVVDARFDQFALLHGYGVSTERVRPGGAVTIELYWEVLAQPPGDFLLFVHLIDSVGTIVTQRDTHPGTGTFPTGQWRPGQRFVDSITLHIPETAYTPETATISIGLYAPTYRLAISGLDGSVLGDALSLGAVTLEPALQYAPPETMIPNPQLQSFDGEIELRGYAYQQRNLVPGDSLQVTLYWEALAASGEGYEVRLQLQDERGQQIVATSDVVSAANWEANTIVTQSYTLTLPPSLAAGTYTVRLVLNNATTQEVHHIVAPDGHYLSEDLKLAGIRVSTPEAISKNRAQD